MRPWYKIHFSTLFLLAIVLAGLVFINAPGERQLLDSQRYVHGWPYIYFERDGEDRYWWSFSGDTPELHISSLLLNIATMLCITALMACTCELWIRRYGRLLRYGIASMLGFTAIIAMIMGLGVRDIHRCYRQQQTLDDLAKLGSMRVMREERKYDWFRSLFGSEFDGTVHRIDIVSAEPTGASVPELSALDGLRRLSLECISLAAQDVEHLATAPALETLFLNVYAIRGDPKKTLARMPAISRPWIHLGFWGSSRILVAA